MTPAPLFHVTSYAAVARIAMEGLRPTAGGGTFHWGSYANTSRGKVFLAGTPLAARAWFNTVDDALEYNAGDHGEAERRVPVMLRISGAFRAHMQVDPAGNAEVPDTYFVTRPIAPAYLSWWWPGRGWAPLSAWGSVPAERGLEPVRDTDEDPQTTYSAYAPGGFKPTTDAQYGAAWCERLPPPKPRVLRVVWRGSNEGAVRELLHATKGAEFGERFVKAWSVEGPSIGRNGLPDPQFWGIKARQAGFPDGVEIVGLPGGGLGSLRRIW